MFSTIKLIYSKINIINQLTKIIAELQKENETLKEQCLVFRNRAQEAEALILKREQQQRDARLVPQPNVA